MKTPVFVDQFTHNTIIVFPCEDGKARMGFFEGVDFDSQVVTVSRGDIEYQVPCSRGLMGFLVPEMNLPCLGEYLYSEWSSVDVAFEALKQTGGKCA